jgi:hypothetical protein
MGALALKPSLYDRDYYAWLIEQAAHIRARQFDQLDYEALAEELEDMGRSERRAVENYLKNLLLHLLKWTVQTERRSGSWRDSIDAARDAIADLLRDSPSLKPHLPEFVTRQYERARRSAANQTGMAEQDFPAKCPFGLDEILDHTFFPGGSEREERSPVLPRGGPYKKGRGPKKKV